MIYVLIEDTSSGRKFITSLFKKLYGDPVFVYRKSNGKVRSISKMVSEIIDKIQPEDIVYLAIDCTTPFDNDIKDISIAKNKLLALIPNQVVLPSYYCFEELLVSHKYLSELFGHDTPMLQHNIENPLYFKEFLKNNNYRGNTYEQLLSDYLFHYTSKIQRGFGIKRKLIGPCWLNSKDKCHIKPDYCIDCRFEGNCNSEFKLLDYAQYMSISKDICEINSKISEYTHIF